MSVPVVDFSPFYHGTALRRAQLATRIIQELQKNGAVRLINHKIPAEVVSECYEWVSPRQQMQGQRDHGLCLTLCRQSEKFFKLRTEEKEAIPNIRNADPQRGWSFVGSEKTSKLNMVDKDGQVPQDLEDEKVSILTPRQQCDALKRWL